MRLAIVVLLGLAIPLMAQRREWTDADGNKVTANFVKLEGNLVTLQDYGKSQRIPLRQFSQADQDYIRQLVAKRAGRKVHRDWLFQGKKRSGTYFDLQDGMVQVKSGRDMLKISISDLDPESHAWLQEQLKSEGRGDLVPATTFPVAPVQPGLNETEERQWIDQKGRKVKARFVRVEDDKVVLLAKGRELKVKKSSLSTADQEHIDQLLNEDDPFAQNDGTNDLSGDDPFEDSSTVISSATAEEDPFADPNDDDTDDQDDYGDVEDDDDDYEPPTNRNRSRPRTNRSPRSSSRMNRRDRFPRPGGIPSSRSRFNQDPFDDQDEEDDQDWSGPSASGPSLSEQMTEQMVYTCSNCSKAVSEDANYCPHCKIQFAYTENEDGSRAYTSGYLAGRIATLVIFVIIVVVSIARRG